jgi:hypothetical protein
MLGGQEKSEPHVGTRSMCEMWSDADVHECLQGLRAAQRPQRFITAPVITELAGGFSLRPSVWSIS